MFDLVTGQAHHLPRHQSVPMLISTATQIVVVGAALAVPYLYVTDQLPEVPTMMAFVAAPPPPPPPPPPPAPPVQAAKPAARQTPRPEQLAAPVDAAPIEAPSGIAAERDEEGFLPGGVEGGVPGGVVGGVVGGVPDVPPPPPPPPPPAPRAPVRIGGQLKAPELRHRVEPIYPSIAVSAKMQGIVILEAIVDEEGRVTDVRVLRSPGYAGVLDRAAIAAVKQWIYSPVLLNGRPTPFVLNVALTFSLG